MDLRAQSTVQRFRGRRPVVVVCHDDPGPWEARRSELDALEATLVVERERGPLSAVLGRPSVSVCDRWLDVQAQGADLDPDDVVEELRFLDRLCEECPQAIHEPGGEGWRG